MTAAGRSDPGSPNTPTQPASVDAAIEHAKAVLPRRLAEYVVEGLRYPEADGMHSEDVAELADEILSIPAAGWRPPAEGPTAEQWGVRCHDGTILPMSHSEDGEKRARGIASRTQRPTAAVKRAVGPWVDADAPSSPLRQGEEEPGPADVVDRAMAVIESHHVDPSKNDRAQDADSCVCGPLVDDWPRHWVEAIAASGLMATGPVRVEWNPTEDRWVPGTVVQSSPSNYVLWLDEGEWVTVARKHCRPLAGAGLLATTPPTQPAEVDKVALTEFIDRQGFGLSASDLAEELRQEYKLFPLTAEDSK